MDRFDVSIIIPSIRDARYLNKLLHTLNEQQYDMSRCEVIVVKDGLDAQDAAIFENFKFSFKLLKNLEQLGPAASRNIGIENSLSDVIAFLDDDCIPHSTWVATLVKAFQNSNTKAVAGKIEILNQIGIMRRYCTYANVLTVPQRCDDGTVKYMYTANCAVLRSAIDEVGRFNEMYRHAGGEDMDISIRLKTMGITLEYCDALVVYHDHSNSLLSWLKKYFFYGAGSVFFTVETSDNLKHAKLSKLFSILKVPYKMIRLFREGMCPQDAFAFPCISYMLNASFLIGRTIKKWNLEQQERDE